MVVLPDQRENNCGQISLERQARNYLFVKGLVHREQGSNRHLEPRALCPLARMIKSRQVSTFRRHARPRFRNHTHYTQTLNPAEMLARHAPQRALNVLQSITRKLSFVLILDFYRHGLPKTFGRTMKGLIAELLVDSRGWSTDPSSLI